jgi:magnesium chelatase subunit ChlD-like protein
MNGVLRRAAEREPARQRWLWLFTDGRTRELPEAPMHADVTLVVDCEQRRIAIGRCRELAAKWNAEYVLLDDLSHGP